MVNDVWWTGRDLNPGPPPCEGGAPCQADKAFGSGTNQELTTVRAAPPAPKQDNALVAGFYHWLQGRVSRDTAEYYSNVVERGEWPPSKGKHVKAWRQYVHYLFSIGRLGWDQYQAYLLFLKTPQSGRHRTVEAVPIETIREYKDILEQAGLGALHTLLLGGARLKHVLKMAAGWNPTQVVRHPTGRTEPRLHCGQEWCRYYLGVVEGSKRTDYVYFPVPGGEARLASPALTYKQLKDRLRRLGVQSKLYRKFANQTLEQLAHEHNIPLDAVALIMSRGLTVTGAHYLNTREWADKLFDLYVEWLKRNRLI